MIHSKANRLMIHGLGQQAATRYKAPDGAAIKQGRWAVADGSGGAQEPAFVFGCYDAPYGVAYATAALASTADYDLSGVAVPAGSMVYLSRAGANATPEELETGVFTTVQSDDTGVWSYEGLEGFDGTLWAWIKVPATMLDALNAAISNSMEVSIHQDAEDANIQQVSIPAVSSTHPDVVANSWSFIDYTVTGNAPAGVEAVYVSDVSDMGEDDAVSVSALTPKVVATAVPDSAGNYTTTWQDYLSASQYLVWCQTESGTLTASMTWTGGTCLSGGTLITMADGRTKRLDEIRPGDLLLAGDSTPTQARRVARFCNVDKFAAAPGTPTRVRRVARGRWNDHHTLYRFSDGTVIDEIHDHRFYNCEAGFWQLLRRWRIGDHARRQDGAEVALVSVERVDEPAEMFGLWTESRDYWANGLLSGETAANQALLADATAEQAAEMMASLEERAILQLLGGLEDLLP